MNVLATSNDAFSDSLDHYLMQNNIKSSNMKEAWVGDFFAPFYMVTMVYFIVDLAWIAICPDCVKSPISTCCGDKIAAFSVLSTILTLHPSASLFDIM